MMSSEHRRQSCSRSGVYGLVALAPGNRTLPAQRPVSTSYGWRTKVATAGETTSKRKARLDFVPLSSRSPALVLKGSLCCINASSLFL
jgi:hypothetical protein